MVEFGCFTTSDNLQFFVRDNGIGIDTTNHKNVFDRFEQVDSYLIGNDSGVGLGLSICKGLIKLMGGKIWVESKLGKGALFQFTIPLKMVNKVSKKNYEIAMKSYDFSQVKILVTEDNKLNFSVIKAMLNESKANIIHAVNGKECLEKYWENPDIDLVLMDIKMPVMDGIEATNKLKALNPDLPIIAQTAFAIMDSQNDNLESNFDDYVTKPIDRNILLESIEGVLLKNGINQY